MQAKSEAFEKETAETVTVTKDITRNLQLLSLTVERLSTLSEINEKRWEHRDK